MEMSPTSRTEGALAIWALTHPSHLANFATGADSDIGGLSQCKLALDEREAKGRFYGTVSSEVPRGGKIERSGYAAFRNKVSLERIPWGISALLARVLGARIHKAMSDIPGGSSSDDQTLRPTRHPKPGSFSSPREPVKAIERLCSHEFSCSPQNRPTLFGNQTWDTTLHPFLALRVRNRFLPSTLPSSPSPSGSSSSPSQSSNPSLRAALHANDPSGPAASRAVHALGLGRNDPPGPKFFVNIQTDGPVTSDLFQHRLYLDDKKGSEWQTVLVSLACRTHQIVNVNRKRRTGLVLTLFDFPLHAPSFAMQIPFDDFVLTNTGQVSYSQVSMMREKIRTIGISVVLDAPSAPSSPAPSPRPPASASAPSSRSGSPLAALSRPTGFGSGSSSASASSTAVAPEEDDWARDGDIRGSREGQAVSNVQRGSRRGKAYNFDLGVEWVRAAGSPEEVEQ